MTSKQIEKRFDFFKTVLCVLISFVIAFILILMVSKDPFETFKVFLIGPLQSVRRMANVIELAIPLTFCGVGVAIMYSANQFSMITQSSFFLAACLSSWFAIYVKLPKGLHSLLVIFMGAIIGGAIAAVPAFMKVKWKASEVVSSLMLNYIVNNFVAYFLIYIFKDKDAGFNASYEFHKSAKLAVLIKGTRIHTGIIVCALVVVFAYLLLYKTKWGYAIRAVGQNQDFAKYSGIAVASVMMYSQIIGGVISGIGGSVEMMGLFTRFTWEAPPTYGNDALMVGILARYNPAMVPLSALFLAYIRTGADVMSRVTDMPIEFVFIIQGVVIMLVAADMFLAKWKHKLIVKNAQKQIAVKEVAK